MAKFICSICGYTHEGDKIPGKCPVCKSPSSQFAIVNDSAPEEMQNVENAVRAKEELSENDSNDLICESPNTITDNPSIAVDKEKETVSEDDINEILNFGAAKLQAVKWYKEKYHCGLKEAKDAVDSIFAAYDAQSSKTNTQTIEEQEYYEEDEGEDNSKSCMSKIGIAVIIILIIGFLYNTSSTSKDDDATAINDSIASLDSMVTDVKSKEYVKYFLEETLPMAIKEKQEHAIRKYFSIDFINLYNEVENIDANISEPIGFWDFDFWTGGQEGELENVKIIDVSDISNNHATAIVQYIIKMGQYDESKVSKHFQLVYEDNKWKVDDFDNYKWRFKDYISSNMTRHEEYLDTCAVDTSTVY